ncbi:zinc finger protein 501-like [Topomyia yanbarensis]|uniref:zinc finger protein 501-like n=1 Tax=Topomyia yanbarensis TaxID=2498891 RepID=UPI00273A817D|nr:zinc finger protein 501-like [Topomyia yanbarensis]XP_058834724.1 zinc finger protein 501-like [Topomyia yanbarensis]XP_058834725.1 zinc finger protein 501-like [Topomyia yanbarensis]XP_058834726.1 zinc finger protein 501-like [Topomyia yanbarensis]XP_058834727.1 zinc finger protein 501-like [Topomyia yanbarensis]XP_058834728.1 zinc finger protein 501-like [Topomyia yanbarensis]XP_058834729.1 zinc finger protein 501-like [Topomyia yanbarensis]
MELIRLLDVCRLCLKQSSTNLNIFSDSNVEDKIVKVFKFALQQNEHLSKLVCLACYECIFRFYDYSESVQQNQTYLDGLLSKDTQHEVPKPALVIPVTDVTDSNATTAAGAIQFNVHIQTDIRSTQEPIPEEETDELGASEPDRPKPVRQTKGDQLIKEYVSLSCEMCAEATSPKFDNFKLLQDHYQQCHLMTGYASCCDRKFTRKDRLITHIMNHIDPNAFKCAVCDHSSKSRSLLKIHMKQHLGSIERRFACGKCEQTFVLRSQLVNHEASHLDDCDKKHVCEECGKAFALRFVLARHKLLHSSTEKEFVCEICAKSLSSKASLKAHMDSHGDEAQPKLKCPVCSNWYKNAETLRTHARVRHRDQRVHRCDECGKNFPTKSSLSAHVKYVHLREMNFGCEQCDKKFRKKVELKEHMARAHSGKSLYQCEFCTKSFSCSSNYFSHRKNKHPKEHANK